MIRCAAPTESVLARSREKFRFAEHGRENGNCVRRPERRTRVGASSTGMQADPAGALSSPHAKYYYVT